jgi:beta-glucanase (GH16 family)
MKMKQLLLAVTASALSLGAQAQCPNIVWADEFSGTALDQTKWSYQLGDGCAEGICGWGNGELQSYGDANVVVSGGQLQIVAKKERVRGAQYTSGRIRSLGKGDWTYGRFEARMKLPAGSGLWPAFWMLPTDNVYGAWPTSGEIDIMEAVGAKPEEVLGTIHYGDAWPNNRYQGNHYTLPQGTFADGFHTFAVEWENGEIRWMVDDILYSRKTAADVAPYLWPFDQNFHFLLNLAVGGSLGGTVDNNIFPATMSVDYVRVYDGFRPYIAGSRDIVYQASGVSYSVGNVPSNAQVSWSVPAGATIVSGQGSSSIVVDWGSAGGNVTANVSTGCGTQAFTLAVAMEPPFAFSYALENFDAPGALALASAGGTLTEVANPAPNATNGSALSGKYVRNSALQYDVLAYSVSGLNGDEYAAKTRKFLMDVYTAAPSGTDIIVQLESSTATSSNYPTGRHSRYVATTNGQAGWQRLTFTLLDRPDGGVPGTDVSSLIVLFAPNGYTGDTYYFDNFDSYAAQTGGTSNQAPTVGLTSPANGSTYTTLATLNLAADANDSDGSVSQVEFFVNGASVGVDAAAPYAVSWTIPAFGSYTITAVATDNQGATATASSSISASDGSTGGGGKGGKPKREAMQGSASDKAMLYPNPASTLLYLSPAFGEEGRYDLIDLAGRTLASGTARQAQQEGIALQALAPGLYLLLLRDAQGGLRQERFIKK